MSNQQRRAALEIANGRRLAHAEVRRHLASLGFHASRREAAAILRDPEGELRHMRARYLLESITYFGSARLGKLIRRTGLAPGRLSARLGELTGRERELIADTVLDLDRVEAGAELSLAERRLVGEVFARLAHHGPAFATVAEKCQVLAPVGQQADGQAQPRSPSATRARNGRPGTAPGAARSPLKAPGANLEGQPR